jgi:hypothetical protein
LTIPAALSAAERESSANPPPPLRIVRLKGEFCSVKPGLEAVEIPYRSEAAHAGEPIGMPDLDFGFDLEANTFAINDDGVIVGAFGRPDDPCVAPTGVDGPNPKRARAFVWVPYGNTTVNAAIPRGQVVDLHAFGGLPTDDRSIAVDVSRSSAWVVGSSGWPFEQNSVAWAWDLAGSTSAGGALATIPAVRLHDHLGNPGEPDPVIAGIRSLGMAVRHEPADPTPTFVGGFTYECGESLDRWKGFRLVFGATPSDTYQLWGSQVSGPLAIARDITIDPHAAGGDPTMVIGGHYGCGAATLDPCFAPVQFCNLPCFNSHRFGALWKAEWDDNEEDSAWTDVELPYLRDRADEWLPPLETSSAEVGSDGFRAEVRANRANAVGEIVGVGARDSTDTDPPTPGVCRHRAGFWWKEEPTEESPWGWKAWDLDREYGSQVPLAVVESRAWGLSERNEARSVLLVGGEDNSIAYPRATCWCGYGETWDRSYVGFAGSGASTTARVRWDELDVVGTTDVSYGLDLVNWQLESVHDVNQLGQMVVLLRGISEESEGRIYPAIVTLASDLNGDFVVSAPDFGMLLGDWGTVPSSSTSTQSDLNGDGNVDATDLAMLIGDWGLATDLHPFFCPPGGSPLMEQANALTSSASYLTGSEVDSALFTLGWSDVPSLQAWAVSASDTQLEGLAQAILITANNQGPNQ